MVNRMSSGEFLAYLGTDAEKWASEFVEHALAPGGSPYDPAPGGWLHGWFCSAIEAGRSADLIDTFMPPAESPTAPRGHRGTGTDGNGAHEDAQGTDGASGDVYLTAARALGYRDEHAEDRTRYTAGTASFRAAIDAACLHERGRIADELLAWANADGTALSRRIKSAAFRIAPELTDDEMRAAIGNLLEGMARRD